MAQITIAASIIVVAIVVKETLQDKRSKNCKTSLDLDLALLLLDPFCHLHNHYGLSDTL